MTGRDYFIYNMQNYEFNKHFISLISVPSDGVVNIFIADARLVKRSHFS